LNRRFGTWIRDRGVWFWALTGTSVAILLLWGGTQTARALGQSVQWYTGFGQWLGALGSLIAAGVALWIAVTDRRHADQRRDADLAREAGLVRVTAEKLGMWQPVGPNIATAAIGVKNRRTDRIFDIEVVRFVMRGEETRPQIGDITLYPSPADRRMWASELPHLAIAPDQLLAIFPSGLPDIPADYAVVQYTDSAGRRWQVDTDASVKRLT
jgi:hypothetical protein